mgnify:CR=1 FL=1
MNINFIINMVVRQVVRRVVNFGIGAGINAVSKAGKKPHKQDGQGPGSSIPGPDRKRAAKQVRLARRGPWT